MNGVRTLRENDKFNDSYLQSLDKRLRDLRRELEDELGMTDTYEKCSCGSRQKSKCVRESGYNTGKMCLKPEDNLFKNFRDTLNGGFCADVDYESEAWQKVLTDWSEFKTEEEK